MASISVEVVCNDFEPVKKTYTIVAEMLDDERIPLEIRKEYEKRIREVINDE